MAKNGSLIASEILIVDDEEDIRDLISGILADEGYATRVAGDSDSALAAVIRVERAGSMADAVRTAFGLTPQGGTVVLAPACSSFDMFRDYAERGRAFKEEVRRLARERRATREQ